MHKTKKLLAVLLVLTLLFAAVPSFAQETELPAEEERTDIAEAGTPPRGAVYESDLEVARGSVPFTTASRGMFSNEELPREGLSREKLSEEDAYVRDTAASVVNPLGLQMEKKSRGTVNVIIWLTELPEALEPRYSTMGIQDPVYDQAKAEAVAARASLKKDAKVEVTQEYSYVFSGFAATVQADYLDTLAAMPGVYCVSSDEYTHELDYEYILDPGYATPGNLGAREMFQLHALHSRGITGLGVKVCVMDSGIQTDHPEFYGAIMGGYDYSGKSGDMSNPDGNHGTGVSGVIASRGMYSLGIAPGVDLYMAQVFPNANVSTILAAINDVTQGTGSGLNGDYLPKMDVVNCSFSTYSQPSGEGVNTSVDAEGYAMNNAVLTGTMFVCAAGNYGRKATRPNVGTGYPGDNFRSPYTVNAPGAAASFGISVAASEYGGNDINKPQHHTKRHYLWSSQRKLRRLPFTDG
ncbi:MAG: S8 family serine peptidase [Clostridiales bacterium]|nr:S8 family serine peptidase [Clostridiales bacterium]